MDFFKIQGLTKYFGGLPAVNGLDFHVQEKEILALIGPNGAGKSTVFNLITAFLKPTSGRSFSRMKILPDYRPIALLPKESFEPFSKPPFSRK